MLSALAYVAIESVVLYTFNRLGENNTHLPFVSELYPWIWHVIFGGPALFWLVATAMESSD